MSPADLVESLKQQGFEFNVGNKNLLTAVHHRGALMCVDGRRSNQPDEVMSCGKILGGIYGVMALRGWVDQHGVSRAIDLIRSTGMVPGIHDDTHHGLKGCGFARLWQEGQIDGFETPSVSLEEIQTAVLASGGVMANLSGGHEEQLIRINLVPGTTFIPDGSAFILDLWLADRLGISAARLADTAIKTVQLLQGPRVVEIFQ